MTETHCGLGEPARAPAADTFVVPFFRYAARNVAYLQNNLDNCARARVGPLLPLTRGYRAEMAVIEAPPKSTKGERHRATNFTVTRAQPVRRLHSPGSHASRSKTGSSIM